MNYSAISVVLYLTTFKKYVVNSGDSLHKTVTRNHLANCRTLIITTPFNFYGFTIIAIIVTSYSFSNNTSFSELIAFFQ